MEHDKERPGVSNLIDIHSSLSGLSISEVEHQARDMDTGEYKHLVADVVVQTLEPISNKIHELRNNKDYVEKVLHDGKLRASEIAGSNLEKVKRIIGLK